MTGTVGIVGPGRVGTALALALARAGVRVVAACDDGGGSAAALAASVAGCRPVSRPVEVAAAAETVLLTVPDDRVADVVHAVAVADAWGARHRVVHCSGALGRGVLHRAALAGARTAACHPAQTVPAGADADTLVGAAWAVTAAPGDRAWAHELVVLTGGDPFDLAEDDRTLYHAALTVGSNAVGAAVAVARQLLLGARVPDPGRVLGPLVEASVANVLRDGATALTGPVVRGDVGTVTAHVEALGADAPRLSQAYRALQGVVLDQAAAELDPAVVRQLAALLEDGRRELPWTD